MFFRPPTLDTKSPSMHSLSGSRVQPQLMTTDPSHASTPQELLAFNRGYTTYLAGTVGALRFELDIVPSVKSGLCNSVHER